MHPKSLDITNYKKFGEATFKAFNDTYFESIYGYNQLMLNVEFYETFSKKYILNLTKLMPLFSKTTSIIGVKRITTI